MLENNVKNIIRGVVIEIIEDHFKTKCLIETESILETINNKKLNPLTKINDIAVKIINASPISAALEYNAHGFFSTTTQNDITNEKILESDSLLDILGTLESRIFSSMDLEGKSEFEKISKLLSYIYPPYQNKKDVSGNIAMLYILSLHKDLIIYTINNIAKEFYKEIDNLIKKVL